MLAEPTLSWRSSSAGHPPSMPACEARTSLPRAPVPDVGPLEMCGTCALAAVIRGVRCVVMRSPRVRRCGGHDARLPDQGLGRRLGADKGRCRGGSPGVHCLRRVEPRPLLQRGNVAVRQAAAVCGCYLLFVVSAGSGGRGPLQEEAVLAITSKPGSVAERRRHEFNPFTPGLLGEGLDGTPTGRTGRRHNQCPRA